MSQADEIEQPTRPWWRLSAGSELPAYVNTILSLILTLVLIAALILAIGANPWEAAKAIIEGSLIEPFFLGQTLMIGSILALTGLAAALPFTSRLWNIGGEGQMFAGAIAAVCLGIELPSGTPKPLFILLVIVGSFLGGAIWGLIPGALKAFYGASEIVTTLMLSFVGVFVANYVITEVWPDPFSQKTVSIAENAQFPTIWDSGNVDISVLIAVAAAGLAWLLMAKTSLGFSIRAIGANVNTARLAGVRTKQVTLLTFLVAGGFAGLAGGVAVAGIFDDLDLNFSSNYGFIRDRRGLVSPVETPLDHSGCLLVRHAAGGKQQPASISRYITLPG